MKPLLYAFSLLICSLSLWSEPDTQPLEPTDDLALLHQAAMDNLQMMADKWTDLAAKTGNRDDRRLYQSLADGYAAYKMTREASYLAEKNQEPIHYEKLREQKNFIRYLERGAAEILGKDMPQLPPEVRPDAPPVPPVEPTPVPLKSHTTESGFEVRLLLEP
jgi:hypothetical protein